MSEITLIAALCLLAGLAAGALIFLLARPRTAETDRAAGEGLAQANARIDAMGSWLQKTQGQLQQTVDERLDAVSQYLGESMKTSTKHTTEHLQKLRSLMAGIATPTEHYNSA